MLAKPHRGLVVFPIGLLLTAGAPHLARAPAASPSLSVSNIVMEPGATANAVDRMGSGAGAGALAAAVPCRLAGPLETCSRPLSLGQDRTWARADVAARRGPSRGGYGETGARAFRLRRYPTIVGQDQGCLIGAASIR